MAMVKPLMMCLLNLSIDAQDLSRLNRLSDCEEEPVNYNRDRLIDTETFVGISLSELHEIPAQFAFFSFMRYQPDLDDIHKAEHILRKDLKKLYAEYRGKNFEKLCI